MLSNLALHLSPHSCVLAGAPSLRAWLLVGNARNDGVWVRRGFLRCAFRLFALHFTKGFFSICISSNFFINNHIILSSAYILSLCVF